LRHPAIVAKQPDTRTPGHPYAEDAKDAKYSRFKKSDFLSSSASSA
jgi:hypothetical protein